MPLARIFIVAVCLVAGVAQAAPPLGQVNEFKLRDSTGTEQTRRSCWGAKGTVLVFLGTECPVSNGYAPELARIAKEIAPRGILVVGVHGDPDVTQSTAAAHAREYGLTFPVLLDPEQQLAAATGVTTMPEVAVLLPSGEVVYRGRIDDKYSDTGKRREVATTQDLRAAITAILADKLPEPAVTKPFGCPLPKVAKPQPEPNTKP